MIPKFLQKLDQKIAERMRFLSVPALRISFGIIFIWFGILKPFGLSAAEELLKATVAWLPFGAPEHWLIAIGWWEVAIGVFFLFKSTTRFAIALLFMQMIGTFMPLVFMPDVTFQNSNPLLPTLEGQYIIKNLMIISGAFAIGGTFFRKSKA
ncbi:MAG: DoxX family membrane protein [Bacteroidota bacterium]